MTLYAAELELLVAGDEDNAFLLGIMVTRNLIRRACAWN